MWNLYLEGDAAAQLNAEDKAHHETAQYVDK